jgi:AraC-like DNA-binding protein
MDNAQNEILFQKINLLMSQEKVYLNPKLKAEHVAHKIGIGYQRLAKVLNSYANTNFETYINSYRLKYACELLLHDKTEQTSISQIAQQAGFGSKTTFYDVFKKLTGQSPAHFQSAAMSKQ